MHIIKSTTGSQIEGAVSEKSAASAAVPSVGGSGGHERVCARAAGEGPDEEPGLAPSMEGAAQNQNGNLGSGPKSWR